MSSRFVLSEPDTPVSGGETPSRLSSRALIVESFKGWGTRVVKVDLRKRILIPAHLHAAMADAPEAPMIVFVNARSGGRHEPVLKGRARSRELHPSGGIKVHAWTLTCVGRGDSASKCIVTTADSNP